LERAHPTHRFDLHHPVKCTCQAYAAVGVGRYPHWPQAMATQDTTQGPALTGVDFEVERFEWTSGDRLEITGRWFGVRGRRFVRPVLNVQLPGGRRRLIALLEHKPWAPHEGEAWIAAFTWEGEQETIEAVELEVGPSLVVDLPAPRGGTVAPPARRATAPRVAARSTGSREELEALRTEAERLRGELREAARLRAELSAATERIETLEEEVRSARSQPAPPPAPDPGVVAQRDAALAERDAAVAARDEAHGARDEALAKRDEALAIPAEELAAARAERDRALARAEAAEAGRASLESARDDAVARAEAAERSREALEFERDQALSTRDAAVAERDAASAERDAAVRARDNARNRARRAGVTHLGEVPPASPQRAAPAPSGEASPPAPPTPPRATPAAATPQRTTPSEATPPAAPTPQRPTPGEATHRHVAPDGAPSPVAAPEGTAPQGAAPQGAAPHGSAAPEPTAPLPARSRPQASATPIFGPAEPLSRRRSSVARLVALLVLAAVVIALLVVLRGVL
jgi:hypothetical protein